MLALSSGAIAKSAFSKKLRRSSAESHRGSVYNTLTPLSSSFNSLTRWSPSAVWLEAVRKTLATTMVLAPSL